MLALDIGSSSVRTALFNERGVRLLESSASRKYSLTYSADGGAEFSAVTLLRATQRCVDETLRKRPGKLPILAVAASAFWHSLLALDKRGEPLTPIFTWADSRSALDAAQLRAKLSERKIQLRTGCMLRPPYWPAKLCWLRRTNPSLFRRAATWISPAAWIFRQLFGVDASSHSMASGTGLYDLKSAGWDGELCGLCHVRPEQLGAICDLALATSARNQLRDAAILPSLGDGAASNLGSGADRLGKVAINVGTSAAVRMMLSRNETAKNHFPDGLFLHVVDPEHLLFGGAVSNAGNLREWCKRELRISSGAEEALSRVAAARDALTVLPYFVNERAPSWPENLRGTITGLAATTSAADIFRAATTSTCYRLAEILDRIEGAIDPAEEVIVSGGILQSPTALTILADCLGRDLRICRELESSLRGAARHALDHLGLTSAPVSAGKFVRHRPALAEQHRERRLKQAALERLLSRAAANRPAAAR